MHSLPSANRLGACQPSRECSQSSRTLPCRQRQLRHRTQICSLLRSRAHLAASRPAASSCHHAAFLPGGSGIGSRRRRPAAAAGHVAAAALSAQAPEHRPSTAQPAKLAVFVSGGGSNLKALHEATQDGRINGSIVVSGGLLFRKSRKHV